MVTYNKKAVLAMMEKAAQEAAAGERKRVLWLLDGLMAKLEHDKEKKLLIEQQRHLVEVKLKIASAIVGELRLGITSGVRPAAPSGEQGDQEQSCDSQS